MKLFPSSLRNLGFFPLLPFLTSVLLILSYPKFDHGWLAWFAMAPLVFYLLRSKSPGAALAGGFGAGFIFYLGILYWIYPTMRAGGVEPPVSALGLVLLAALLALEFALVSGFGFYLKKAGPGAFPYVFSAAWALMEWAKVAANLKGAWFPWFTLAYTQWHYTRIIQVVSVTGLYGLSWAVCFTGALAGAVAYKREKTMRTAWGLAPGLLVALGLWSYGGRVIADAPAAGNTLKVSLLQPCINLYDKWDEARAGEIEAKIEGLVKSAAKRDLVVWPENALPGWIEEKRYGDWVLRLARESGAVHIVGSVSRGDGRRVAAFLIKPSGEPEAEYQKRVLVPFGEYVPLRNFLGKFIGPVAALGEFYPGRLTQPLMNVKGVKTAPMICYESIFPFLFRQDAGRGAALFVNITNDGWYLDTAAPYQHLLVNIFRAVETRRPVLRAANNGISAYIDPYGRVRDSLGLNVSGVLNVEAEIDPDMPESRYTRNGDLFVSACAMLCAAFLLAVMFL